MLRIENVNDNFGDIVEIHSGLTIYTQYLFSSKPKEGTLVFDTDLAVDSKKDNLKKVIKLKEAGFEVDDIVTILKEL